MQPLPIMPTPSEVTLLRFCADTAGDEIIRGIAAADWEHDPHVFSVLRESLDRRTFPPAPNEFSVYECLCLTTSGTHSRNMTARDHLVRLFAACVLFHLSATGEWEILAYEGTLARMTESAIGVGPSACDATMGYVAWLAENDADCYARSFHALATILLQVATNKAVDYERQLQALEVQWQQDLAAQVEEVLLEDLVRGEEACVDKVLKLIDDNKLPWLLCLDTQQSQYGPWRRLARSLLPNDDSELGRLRRRLDPPGWPPPNPLA
jgi:hypothetical protein